MFRKREIGLDLTSLLDVILIMLFMLVVNQSSQVANTMAEEAQNAPSPTPTAISEEQMNKELSDEITIKKEELEELKKHYDSVKQDVATNEIWTQTCAVANLTITYNNDNKLENFVFNIKQEGKDTQEYTVKKIIDNDNNTKLDEKDENSIIEAINKEAEKLNDYQQIILLVFTYDGTKIYREDFKAITSVLNDIHNSNDKILVAMYDISNDNGEVIKESGDTYNTNSDDKNLDSPNNEDSSSEDNTNEDSFDTNSTNETDSVAQDTQNEDSLNTIE